MILTGGDLRLGARLLLASPEKNEGWLQPALEWVMESPGEGLQHESIQHSDIGLLAGQLHRLLDEARE